MVPGDYVDNEEELRDPQKRQRVNGLKKVINHGLETILPYEENGKIVQRKLGLKSEKEDVVKNLDKALLEVVAGNISTRNDLRSRIAELNAENEAERILQYLKKVDLINFDEDKVKLINDFKEAYGIPKNVEEDKIKYKPSKVKDLGMVASAIHTSEKIKKKPEKVREEPKYKLVTPYRWTLATIFALTTIIALSNEKYFENSVTLLNYCRDSGRNFVNNINKNAKSVLDEYRDKKRVKKEISEKQGNIKGIKEAEKIKAMLVGYPTEQYETATPKTLTGLVAGTTVDYAVPITSETTKNTTDYDIEESTE